MKKGILIHRTAAAALFAALAVLLQGCLTPRSDFKTVGEVPLFSAEKTSNPYYWNVDKRWPAVIAGTEGGKAFFRFPSSGQTSLLDSVVGDFRMEFEARLEAPVEYEIATAMINFRYFFDRRYCLILEPEQIWLGVSKGSHPVLSEFVGYKTEITLFAWNSFEIVAVGNRIMVFMNGRLIIDVFDKGSEVLTGNIVFESHSKYSFRNVTVAKIADFVKIETPKSSGTESAAIPVPKEKLTVAVSGFEGRGVEAYKASLLTDLYSAALLSTGVFRVVERSQLAKVLAEQEFQLSDVADSKTATAIGNILNAEYLSSGSVGMLGSQYVVTVKLMKVKTGETLVSAQKSYADADKIPEGLSTLCAEIARKLLVK